MAELKRKDEELTTADLAGRSEKPQLVRSERPEELESVPEGGLRNTGDVASAEPVESRYIGKAERQQPTPIDRGVTGPPPLFSEADVNDSRARWGNIQAAFVDEPRRAVEDADSLVASLMKKLAEGFANEREKLEKQWARGEDVSTEDLRIALQRYRSFFDRLLKV